MLEVLATDFARLPELLGRAPAAVEAPSPSLTRNPDAAVPDREPQPAETVQLGLF
jgi:hypothetical protein